MNLSHLQLYNDHNNPIPQDFRPTAQAHPPPSMYLSKVKFPPDVCPGIGFAGSPGSFPCSFVRTLHAVSHGGVPMYTPSLFFLLSPEFTFFRLFDDGHSDQCEVIPHCRFLFLFLGLHLQHVEVPKLGAESELSPPAYTTVPSNTRSLTHWARPGIEPASSWLLVSFVSTEPWGELPSL